MPAHSKLTGFTLLELLVVMGIIAMVTVVVLPFSVNDLRNSNLRNLAVNLTSQINNYQFSAALGKDNLYYGINIGTTSYTLFNGTSLAAASQSEEILLDSGYYFSNINLLSAGSEIIFKPNSIKPLTSGFFRLSDQFNTYEISINTEGFLEWYKI